MKGTLYICGTPIGNLEDITLRALNTLKEIDLIVAEDTRHTLKLLNFYNIKKKITSYHEHNKKTKGIKLIELLKTGTNIALVSDAGMPCISDPGYELVDLCYKNNISVTSVPGATAVITGLVLSGIETRKFVFEGFLSSNKKNRQEDIERLKKEIRTIVIYESPHSLKGTLEDLYNKIGDRKISIVREMTKKYEEVNITTLKESIKYYETVEPRGEYVLVIEGIDKEELKKEEISKWDTWTIKEHYNMYLSEGIERKEAMKLVAKDRNLSKREIYSKIIE